jgi:5-methylcytosine-specific restriction endonuclease McrA
VRKGGPTGRPWRRLRAEVLAASTVCVLCGHDGAGDVHHLVPRSQGGDLLDPANCAPAHGALSPCPWCLIACNQSAGIRGHATPRRQAVPLYSRAW